MRRIAVVVATVVGPSLVPLTAGPAAAATKRTVAPCRSAGCFPASFAFAPNGRLFYAERFSGQIRVKKLSTGRDSRWATVRDLATGGEQGLLGIAIDPRWERGPRFRWVYVYLTRDGSPDQNQIWRLRKRDGRLERDLLARIPAAAHHNGGVIGFGPDGKLYAVTGDAGSPANSQTTANLAGKVVRMKKNGGTPSDNPVIGGRRTRIWSFGHRNSFGFTFDPFASGRVWQTENGPGGSCDDEINRIVKGRNYGWGPSGTTCGDSNDSGPSPTAPALLINPGIAPTGAAFCKGCGLPGLEGRLLYGSWNDGRIRALTLSGDRTGVAGAPADVFPNGSGILGLRRYKGRIYFSDPNGVHRLDP